MRSSTRAFHDDYEYLCASVLELSGVDLRQYRRAQMERRIRSFARRRQFNVTLREYADLLRADPHERAVLLDRVTINVSQLWRNAGHWQLLADEVLPRLPRHGLLRAWSAGCSNGAEAYTLAALCLERLPRVRTRILATDLDAAVIERARSGVFSAADAKEAPRQSLERWFELDEQAGTWRAREPIRRCLEFRREDLTTSEPAANAYDLVVCRNVVIYLEPQARQGVHERLARSLRPGGFLFVGATERIQGYTTLGLDHPFPFIYRRRTAP